MIKQKALIGMELDRQSILIEKGLLRRVYKAIHEPDITINDSNTLENLDHLPPCFLGSLINMNKIYKTLDLNIKNVMLSRESIITNQPITEGDTILAKIYLQNAYEQQAMNNPLGFMIVVTIGEKNGTPAFLNEKVLFVRGGFDRRKI